MKKYFLIKKLYQFIIVFLLILIGTFNINVNAAPACSDEQYNFCELPNCSGDFAGKFVHIIINPDNASVIYGSSDTKESCLSVQKIELCRVTFKYRSSCDPRLALTTVNGGALPQNIPQNLCLGKNFTVDASNIEDLNTKQNWTNRFSNLLGDNYDETWNTADPTKNKTRMYGVWKCEQGYSPNEPAVLKAPATAPSPTRCDFPMYDVFGTSIGSTTCGGSEVCAREGIIRDGSGSKADKKFYCVNDKIVMCPNTVTTYAGATTPGACVNFNNLTSDNLFGTIKYRVKYPIDYSPVNLIKTISNFLFYVAILYFVLLMLSNGFAYVRAAEDPGKLKEIKASLFNTIAGFLFVLLSGGLIISLINSIGL